MCVHMSPMSSSNVSTLANVYSVFQVFTMNAKQIVKDLLRIPASRDALVSLSDRGEYKSLVENLSDSLKPKQTASLKNMTMEGFRHMFALSSFEMKRPWEEIKKIR